MKSEVTKSANGAIQNYAGPAKRKGIWLAQRSRKCLFLAVAVGVGRGALK